MARKFFRRFIPSPEKLRNAKGFGFVGERVFEPSLWHLTRRSVRAACFIGIFVALIPMPFQMVAAASLAIMFRCNLPIAVSLVWTTNPITMPPVFYTTYLVGNALLDREPSLHAGELTLASLGSDVLVPLYLGSIVSGVVLGLAFSMLVDVFWRLHVLHNWRKRSRTRGAA